MSRGTKRSSHDAFGGARPTTATAADLLQKHRSAPASSTTTNGAATKGRTVTFPPHPNDNNDNNDDDADTPTASNTNTNTTNATSKPKPSLKAHATSLLATRKALPIYQYRQAIREALRGDKNDVLLLAGETGSGKSTQIPQFLVGEGWCRPRKVRLPVRFLGGAGGEDDDDVGGSGSGSGATGGVVGRSGSEDRRGAGGGGVSSKRGQEAVGKKKKEEKEEEEKEETREVTVGGMIAITQPRRVAAISLAKRVAEEMDTPLGGRYGEVGYSVRFDNQAGPKTRVKFLTEGMLLQEMLRDPSLREYSAVVVDEVHERSVGVDLCLGVLRGLVRREAEGDGGGGGEGWRGRRGVPLKVVVMSATAGLEGLEEFFGGVDGGGGQGLDEVRVEKENEGKRRGKGEAEEVNDEEFEGFSDDDSPAHTNKPSKALTNGRIKHPSTKKSTPPHPTTSKPPGITTLRIPGRLFPITINHLPTPTSDIISAALDRIIHIHIHAPLPGDILVFLPGQETIESLLSLLKSYAASLNSPDTPPTSGTTRNIPSASTTNSRRPNDTNSNKQKPTSSGPRLPALQPLPLYASLPSHLQSLPFLPTPRSTRRVTLATNIAETSLTLPSITHVIDSGLHKTRIFRPSLNLDSLVVSSISKSSAAQRAGRAGRVAKGEVWRLYTEKDWAEMKREEEPEVLRGDLASTYLMARGLGVRDVVGWAGWVTKPSRKGWRAGVVRLLSVGALDGGGGGGEGRLTRVGRELGSLPLPVGLGRCLLSSVQLGCVPQVVDLVSALAVGEGVFLNLGRGEASDRSALSGTSRRDGEGAEGNDDDDDDDEVRDPRLKLRQQLYRREGDHLTLLATVQAYTAENADRKRWCVERGISHRAMLGVMEIRKQLTGIMERKAREQSQSQSRAQTEKTRKTTKMTAAQNGQMETTTVVATGGSGGKQEGGGDDDDGARSSSSSTLQQADLSKRVLLALLTGLHPNVAILSGTSSTSSSSTNKSSSSSANRKAKQDTSSLAPAQYLTLTTHQAISIHPSSVLFGRKVEAIVGSEFVFTSKSYARCVSAVEMGWVGEAVGLVREEVEKG